MSFRDRMVFRCCLGLGEGHYPGFTAAVPLVQQAWRSELLPLPDLDDLSILLLLLVCPTGTRLHEAAFSEAQRRRLEPINAWATLREGLRPNLSDLHYLAYNRQPRQQGLLRSTYNVLYVPAVAEFLSRSTMAEPDVAQAFAAAHFHQIYPAVQPAFPRADGPATVDEGLLIELYGSLLRRSDWSIADDWPTPRPEWVKALDADEERFLTACLSELEPDLRCLLYLSFYGELNVRTITRVLRQSGDPRCRPADVVHHLRTCWSRIFAELGSA